MGRPFWRGVLAGLILLSLAWSGWSLWRVVNSPLGGLLIERAEGDLGAAYERALMRRAGPKALAERISERLEDPSRNWVALEGLMELAQAQGVTLPDELTTRYSIAYAQDHSLGARAASCAACAYDLRACTMGADLACGLSVNLTVFGDVLSLSRESAAFARGEAVDQLDVTLSFIGIGATGLAVATGGASYSLKLGAGMMKTAHRMGRITPQMQRIYRNAARNGVDWAQLRAARNMDDLMRARRMEALRPALDATEAFGTIGAQTGLRGGLHLVAYIDDVAQAQQMARATRVLGPRSVGALEMLGKSRFLRTGLRLSQPLWEALAALAAAFSGLLAMIWTRLLRIIRRRI